MTPFNPLNTNAIAATATSQSRAMPTGAGRRTQVSFYNDGPGVAFVDLGSAAVVATLPVLTANTGAEGAATPIPVGQVLAFSNNPEAPYWAVICPAGNTANVYCTVGEGN